MRSEYLTRGRCVVGLLSLSVVGGGWAIVACNTGEGETTTSVTTYADGAPILGDDAAGDDAGGDDDGATPYMGTTMGGTVVAPNPAEAGSFAPGMPIADGAPDIVDTTCCNLTFVFDPATLIEDAGSTSTPMSSIDAGDGGDGGDAGDAGASTTGTAPYIPTSVSLVGDAYPLANGASIPMTKANGVWTATACVPPSEYLRYRFFLGDVPIDPTGMSDAEVPDYACDPNTAQVSDGFGGCYNTFGPVNACSDVDASVGMVSNDH